MLKEYFGGVMLLSAFISLSLGVAHSRLKRVTEFGAGILLICAILLPIVDIIADYEVKIDSEIYLDEIDMNATDDLIESAFEDGIREYLATEYRVEPSLVSVRADGFDMGKMRAERIYVTLSGSAAYLDYKRIENEVASEFTDGGECEVSLNIG